MNNDTKTAIAKLLLYSLKPTNSRFSALTRAEQEIVKNQETLDQIIEWASANSDE